MYTEIKQRATASLKWAALGQWLSRAVQPLIMLAMARLLTPSEYGTLAVMTLVVALAQLFQDSGVSRALIQSPDETGRAANAAFWINLLLSVLLYAVMALAAPWIAAFFRVPEAAAVIIVAGLRLVILAFGTVQVALAQRALQFQALFFSQLVGALVLALTFAGLAYLGFGLWAFVLGSLAGAAVQVALLGWASPWRPSLALDLTRAAGLLRFGLLAALEAFQGWLIYYGDNVVVGHFLGVEALGTYALAFNITIASLGLLAAPLTSVAYASFSRLQSKHDEIVWVFLNLLRVWALLMIPIGMGLMVTAGPLVQLALEGHWAGIALVIQLLAFFPGVWGHLVVMNPELYKALGRPDVMPRLLLITVLYSVPAYLVGAQFGLLGFCIARISVTVIFFPVHVGLITRFLRLRIAHLWDCVKVPLAGALGMAAVVSGMLAAAGVFSGWQGWVKLAGVVLVGAGSYTLIVWRADRSLMQKAFQLIRQVV